MLEPSDLPKRWTPLRTWDQLQRMSQRGGLVVIVDNPTDRDRGGPRFHHPDCDHVAERHFEEKRSHGWRNGAYYWVPDQSAAVDGQARACAVCGGARP